ncbi:MAG: LysM peptidoglycan-binding domain-containing protein [Actinomycetota bacterium]|nr:LysM peptidoglycan-binding domain-containing protein [Actinomycetota bacterium]
MAVVAAMSAPAAQAAVHTVAAGESLSSIAALDGLSTDALAAANGLSSEADLVAGSTIDIPAQDGSQPSSSGGGGGGGSYVVRPGDTLSGIAAAEGMSTAALADANGLAVDAPLVAGTTLTFSGAGGGGGSAGSSASTGEGPIPTSEVVSGDQIAREAATQNVGPNFAKAVAWQESGWDNSQVSSADARGVMQITPDTWDFIQNNLAGGRLDPASALDNVRAGATYLGYLFDQTGNDPASTLGSYYQGLGGVLRDGLLPESQQYVDSVLALRDSFASR